MNRDRNDRCKGYFHYEKISAPERTPRAGSSVNATKRQCPGTEEGTTGKGSAGSSGRSGSASGPSGARRTATTSGPAASRRTATAGSAEGRSTATRTAKSRRTATARSAEGRSTATRTAKSSRTATTSGPAASRRADAWHHTPRRQPAGQCARPDSNTSSSQRDAIRSGPRCIR